MKSLACTQSLNIGFSKEQFRDMHMLTWQMFLNAYRYEDEQHPDTLIHIGRRLAEIETALCEAKKAIARMAPQEVRA